MNGSTLDDVLGNLRLCAAAAVKPAPMNTEQLQFFTEVTPPTSPKPRPRGAKQREVVRFLTEHKYMSVTDAAAIIGWGVYTNVKKHTGRVLSNMVRKGLLTRAKRGLYQLP